MKRIMVKFTVEIDNAKFDKYCEKQMIGKKVAVVNLRDFAETAGRVLIYDKIETILEVNEE